LRRTKYRAKERINEDLRFINYKVEGEALICLSPKTQEQKEGSLLNNSQLCPAKPLPLCFGLSDGRRYMFII
jgi:hypothetical protein